MVVNGVAITPWRHLRAKGGIIVDMGIHYADLQEFYLGPIAQVVGMNALIDRERVDAQGQSHPLRFRRSDGRRRPL